jgi:nucleotide-binding universal stress UspA family protein
MRQIIVALEAADVKTNAIDFACYLANLTRSKLVCALMDGNGEFIKEEEMISTTPGKSASAGQYPGLDAKANLIKKNKIFFSEACSRRGVISEFLPEIPLTLNELIKESRFSDLIIADVTISFQKRFEGIPSMFLEQLLKRTECPVIVAPESFDGIQEIVFAYDGSESAMFAIRQFAHLFPELSKTKLTVVEVVDENDRLFTEQDRLAQWLKNYYSNVEYKRLYGRPKDELFGYLLEKENIIVVMGAFGRTMLSALLSKSNAELILKAVNLPVFISHT